MDRRHFLALTAALPALAAVLQACGGDDSSSSSTTSVGGDDDGPMQLRSSIERVSVEPDQAVTAATAINAFGADVHRHLTANDPDTNLVFSPASILLALTMTRAGAVGATAMEMDAVLHVDDATAFYPAVNALSAAVDALSRSVDIGADEPVDVVVALANSLWAQAGFSLQPAFLDLLGREFGAGVELVDYRTDPEGARRAINAWVADNTEDRIPELLAAGTIDADSRLTLVNAIYMKAPWDTPFTASATSQAPFHRADGTAVDVPMMRARRHLGHAAGDGWQAIELPYAGGGLAMVLVLPDADPAAVEAQLPAAIPASTDLQYREVQLGMPRWDIETSASMNDVLTALGMPTAFADDADFSGMTTEEPLQIGAVVHQANITVDEEGTEAAAATAVVMRATGAAPSDEPLVLTFDRPFLFAIRGTTTGAILFQGRITDPSS